MRPEDREWLRALPLLLTASVLLIGGALAFFRAGDSQASTAAFVAGLVCLGAWLTTAIVEWHVRLSLKRRRPRDRHSPPSDLDT